MVLAHSANTTPKIQFALTFNPSPARTVTYIKLSYITYAHNCLVLAILLTICQGSICYLCQKVYMVDIFCSVECTQTINNWLKITSKLHCQIYYNVCTLGIYVNKYLRFNN